MVASPAFSISFSIYLRADPFKTVEVRTKRGVTRALLFAKTILRAEFEAEAPMREAMRIKRERL